MGLRLEGPAWLFCPADRPDRFEKAAATADVVVIDLEDSVLPGSKTSARDNVVAAAPGLDPLRTVVRVNPMDTPWGAADLEALIGTSLQVVMLPKVGSAPDLTTLGEMDVVALCETAAGVLAAADLAQSPRCIALTWGGQDLALDLGSAPRASDGGLHPTGAFGRLMVRYAAAVAGIPAIDTVWTNIDDIDGLGIEADDAASAGFDGKLAIHPSQVPVIRAAFKPAADDVERAHRILAEAKSAQARGEGAARVAGELLDAPVVERARRIVARAARYG